MKRTQIFFSPDRFAAGKGSALVIDVGQTMASVTPVVDGFVLRKGMCSILLITGVKWILHEPFSFSGLVYSALPELVQAHARHVLVTPNPTRHGIELLPHQLIASKLVSSFKRPRSMCCFDIYIF